MRSATWLADQLPAGMSENQFLLEFLSIFQHLSDTVLNQVDTLPDVFDPSIAPTAMVAAMAEWIGVDWIDPELDDRLQRDTVLTYSQGLPRRGTRSALVKLLQVLCCSSDQRPSDVVVKVTEVCPPDTPAPGVFYVPPMTAADDPMHVCPMVEVRVPTSGSYHVDDLVRIVRSEIPLGVLLTMFVDDREVWPRAEHASQGADGMIEADDQYGHIPEYHPDDDEQRPDEEESR